MRKVTFGGASSLDNFIARKDDSYDWIMWCKEAGEIMRDYWKNIDTVVMGRRTYEVAASHGPLPVHKGVQTYVFSRTLKQRGKKGLTFVSEDVVDFVRRLKEEDGRDICVMGGGVLAKPLFEAGLIDETRSEHPSDLIGFRDSLVSRDGPTGQSGVGEVSAALERLCVRAFSHQTGALRT